QRGEAYRQRNRTEGEEMNGLLERPQEAEMVDASEGRPDGTRPKGARLVAVALVAAVAIVGAGISGIALTGRTERVRPVRTIRPAPVVRPIATAAPSASVVPQRIVVVRVVHASPKPVAHPVTCLSPAAQEGARPAVESFAPGSYHETSSWDRLFYESGGFSSLIPALGPIHRGQPLSAPERLGFNVQLTARRAPFVVMASLTNETICTMRFAHGLMIRAAFDLGADAVFFDIGN